MLYESASDLRFTQDFRGKVLQVNRNFERSLGVNRSVVVGTNITEWIQPAFREMYQQRVMEHFGGAPAIPMEVELLGPRGPVPLQLSLELMFSAGKPVGLHAIGRDLTDQVRSRMERAAVDLTLMRQTEELATFSRYVQLLHRLSTTSYPTLDDLFSEYLATGSQIFRLECGAVLQQTTTGLVPRKVWGTQSSGVLHSLAMEIMDEGDTLVGPLPGKANGSASFRIGTILQTATESFGVLLFWSDNSRETHPQALEMVEMMARGIESAVQQRRLTDELERRARHDGLTGLANRMTLAERLHSAIEDARRDGRSVGVIFMDLDKFKAINDSLGHAAGDAALQEVARRFEQSSGAGVFLARVGGDEFAAVVPEVSTVAQVVETASQLLLCLSEPMFVFGEETHLTASSGVSMFPEDGDDGAALLRKADSAMYEGKQAGGNQIRTAGVPA